MYKFLFLYALAVAGGFSFLARGALDLLDPGEAEDLVMLLVAEDDTGQRDKGKELAIEEGQVWQRNQRSEPARQNEDINWKRDQENQLGGEGKLEVSDEDTLWMGNAEQWMETKEEDLGMMETMEGQEKEIALDDEVEGKGEEKKNRPLEDKERVEVFLIDKDEPLSASILPQVYRNPTDSSFTYAGVSWSHSQAVSALPPPSVQPLPSLVPPPSPFNKSSSSPPQSPLPSTASQSPGNITLPSQPVLPTMQNTTTLNLPQNLTSQNHTLPQNLATLQNLTKQQSLTTPQNLSLPSQNLTSPPRNLTTPPKNLTWPSHNFTSLSQNRTNLILPSQNIISESNSIPRSRTLASQNLTQPLHPIPTLENSKPLPQPVSPLPQPVSRPPLASTPIPKYMSPHPSDNWTEDVKGCRRGVPCDACGGCQGRADRMSMNKDLPHHRSGKQAADVWEGCDRRACMQCNDCCGCQGQCKRNSLEKELREADTEKKNKDCNRRADRTEKGNRSCGFCKDKKEKTSTDCSEEALACNKDLHTDPRHSIGCMHTHAQQPQTRTNAIHASTSADATPCLRNSHTCKDSTASDCPCQASQPKCI